MALRFTLAAVLFSLATPAVRAQPSLPAFAERPPAAEQAAPRFGGEAAAEAKPNGHAPSFLPATLPNLPTMTLGGEQVWSDELVFRGWRIQQNVVTGHYRLLDAKDVRQAWGSWDQCRAAFDRAREREGLKPLEGKVVVTLHGLGRSRDHMEGISRYLEEQGDFTCVDVTYASTRRTLDEHAQSLARVLEHLSGAEEIHFVCHSLGNLVVRRYLGEADSDEPRWKPDPRIQRMVMLGPPNNGAQLAGLIARIVQEAQWAQWLAGPSATALALEWDEARKLLATPPFPFGIVAGGCGDDRGLNPWLKGDDDMVVCVEETRLPGAADFRLVNCRHGALMSDATVRKCVLTFLQHGYFSTADERQPIEPPAPQSPTPQP
jgi:hypothetical protein